MSDYSIRSVPQQSRSQERVDSILGTAADLFTEVGYEAATTNAIAERAGISIGTLYRYFADKDAILRALAARYHREEQALFDQVFTDDVGYLPLPVLLDRLIDPFLDLYCGCPVYAHILLGTDVSADIAAASQEIEQEVIERLADIMQKVAPQIDARQARLTAVICKSAVKSLISLRSSSNDEDFRVQITSEIKQMLLAYLEKVLDETESQERHRTPRGKARTGRRR
ncbi:MAG: TetR/AcrR family transcriptional regulator [Anaerolineae bacterium]|nr:TetR/AcrR family transcriptional regulator [Anaerolineae bacterium]